jgi:hypothetical protein
VLGLKAINARNNNFNIPPYNVASPYLFVMIFGKLPESIQISLIKVKNTCQKQLVGNYPPGIEIPF